MDERGSAKDGPLTTPLDLLEKIKANATMQKGSICMVISITGDVHLQKVQLSPEDQHPRDVRSGPVRGEEDAKCR